ncbi:MAG: carboxymuconolactone decarboxylase family protein [Mesorhizobium sp.]
MTITNPSEAISIFEGSTTRHAGSAGQSTDLHAAIRELLAAFRSLVIEDPLLNLVAARAAQLNRCAPSLAAHIELARRQGEHPMRLCHLSAWRDSSLFGPRERAALEWAEILATSLTPVALKSADDCVDIGLSAKDISILGFVIAVVNLCSQLQLTSAVLRPA